jgi:hypothetical protein
MNELYKDSKITLEEWNDLKSKIPYKNRNEVHIDFKHLIVIFIST